MKYSTKVDLFTETAELWLTSIIACFIIHRYFYNTISQAPKLVACKPRSRMLKTSIHSMCLTSEVRISLSITMVMLKTSCVATLSCEFLLLFRQSTWSDFQLFAYIRSLNGQTCIRFSTLLPLRSHDKFLFKTQSAAELATKSGSKWMTLSQQEIHRQQGEPGSSS